MATAPPESFRVFISKIAPKIITKISNELSAPNIEDAKSGKTEILSEKKPIIIANTHDAIRHHFADKFKNSIKTKVKIIGKNEIICIKNTSLFK